MASVFFTQLYLDCHHMLHSWSQMLQNFRSLPRIFMMICFDCGCPHLHGPMFPGQDSNLYTRHQKPWSCHLNDPGKLINFVAAMHPRTGTSVIKQQSVFITADEPHHRMDLIPAVFHTITDGRALPPMLPVPVANYRVAYPGSYPIQKYCAFYSTLHAVPCSFYPGLPHRKDTWFSTSILPGSVPLHHRSIHR